MSTSADFLDQFEEFVAASGWRIAASPAALVQQWRDFVDEVADGYSATIYEYTNDRSVRDLLEKVFNDPGLQKFDETYALRHTVEDIDAHLRALCREDVEMDQPDAPWWRRCVPRTASGEFSDDLHSRLRITASTSPPRHLPHGDGGGGGDVE